MAESGKTIKHHVPYEDLRQWIDEADKLGELRRVDGATWQEDIGLATELLQHDEKAPTALFDKIPGVPVGYRVLVNFFGGKRMNMTLGFPTTLEQIRAQPCLPGRLPGTFLETAPLRSGGKRSCHGKRHDGGPGGHHEVPHTVVARG